MGFGAMGHLSGVQAVPGDCSAGTRRCLRVGRWCSSRSGRSLAFPYGSHTGGMQARGTGAIPSAQLVNVEPGYPPNSLG